MSHLNVSIEKTRSQLFWWFLGLAVITILSVLWVNFKHINISSDFSFAIIVIAYSSSLAAIIAAFATGGLTAVKNLLWQIGRWRISAKLYLFTLLLPALIFGVAHVIYRMQGGESPSPLIDLSALLPGLAAIISGALGEEIGWRGLAQPLLQHRLSIFWASIIVGIIWATWHSWPIVAPGGQDGQWILEIALTYLRLISTAVIYGWLYNASKGSLLLVMIAHAAHNIVATVMFVPGDAYLLSILVAVFYFTAAVIVSSLARHELFSKPARSI